MATSDPKDQKSKRGGYRPGSGRKRKSQVDVRTVNFSARTTPELKQQFEDACLEDRTTVSDQLHRLVEEWLRRRGELKSAPRPAKRLVFVLQQVEVE